MGWDALDLLLVALLAVAVAWMYRHQASREAPATPGRRGHDRTGLTRLAVLHEPLARQAGFDPVSIRLDYWLAKGALAAVLPVLALELAGRTGAEPSPVWLLPLAIVGFFAPDLWLIAVRRRRRRKISAALSHFLDLIVALLLSGSSLEGAVRRAARAGFPPGHPLAREIEVIGHELEAGKDVAEAFGDLARRTGVPAILGVASALKLGTQVGMSVQATLEAQADLLWNRHVEEVRRTINTAGIKASLGVILCALPVWAVFALFPVIMDLLDALRALFGSR